MNPWLEGMNRLAAGGVTALLNTLWYAAAVVGLAWLILPRLARWNAATRYWIWVAILAFITVLPFLPGLLARGASADTGATATALPLAQVATPPESVHAPILITLDTTPGANLWPLCLLAAWGLAASWKLARLGGALAAVRRLKAEAAPAQDGDLPLRLRRPLRLLASPAVDSPVAVGFLRPAVIVPPGLLARLEEGERQDVLLHELAHLSRYDDWLALGTSTLAALLALHPLAALVLGRIEREREMACDDFVVARTGAARTYARSLARLHDLRWSTGTRLLAAGLFGRRPALSARLDSLLRRGRKFSARPSLASLAASGLLLVALLGAGGLIPGWIAIAAPQAAPKSFYVASIKPGSPTMSKQRMIGVEPGGRFNAVNISLKMLLLFAYEIKPAQLEQLPPWASSKTYSIQAVPPPGTPNLTRAARSDQVRQMLRSLLAERFHLQVHRETREMAVDDLVIAKGGPRLKPGTAVGPGDSIGPQSPDAAKFGAPPPGGPLPTQGPAPAEYADQQAKAQANIRVMRQRAQGVKGGPGVMMRPGRLIAYDAPLSMLIDVLSQRLGRVVIDKTGLTGKYDFTLNWTPGPGEAGGMGLDGPSGGPEPNFNFNGPSLFVALQEQLGLRLKSAKGPVEVLVVDHITPPTPN